MSATDYPKQGANTSVATQAMASLYVWGAVIDLLEDGCANHCSDSAKQRVIKLAKAEQQKDLARLDRAVGKINGGAL